MLPHITAYSGVKRKLCSNYFSNLYPEDCPTEPSNLAIPSLHPNVNSAEDDINLLRTPTEEEGKKAVSSINTDKALGTLTLNLSKNFGRL